MHINIKNMSIREVQDIIYRLGVFMFRGGLVNEGMVVARYNISDAKIDYYFIHTSKVNDYRQASNSQARDAHKRYGHPVDINSIIKAQLFK